MTFENQDEYPLKEKPVKSLWAENYALGVSDPYNCLSIFISMGTWYADTSIWRETLGVNLPNGHTLYTKNYGRNTNGSIVSASLLKYEIMTDDCFNLSFSGPVWRNSDSNSHFLGGATELLDLNINFEATAPLWDMVGNGNGDRTAMAGAMHIEQIGRCSGVLRCTGHEIAIKDAPATRDHSRGVRDPKNYKSHCWIQGEFTGGRAFHLYAMNVHSSEGIAMSHATVIQDRKHYPATVTQITFVDSVNDARKPHIIIIDSELGEMIIHVREIFSHVPIAFTAPYDVQVGFIPGIAHAYSFEESAHMEWDGKPGVGFCERGFCPQPL